MAHHFPIQRNEGKDDYVPCLQEEEKQMLSNLEFQMRQQKTATGSGYFPLDCMLVCFFLKFSIFSFPFLLSNKMRKW